jgi:hypothetical protein
MWIFRRLRTALAALSRTLLEAQDDRHTGLQHAAETIRALPSAAIAYPSQVGRRTAAPATSIVAFANGVNNPDATLHRWRSSFICH